MLKLLRFLKPYWKFCILLILAVVLQILGTLQLPRLMSEIVNEGIVKNDTGFIWQTGLLMIVWAILAAGGALAANFFAAKIGTGFAKDIREAVFRKVLSFSISETDKLSTASLITRTTNDINQVQQVTVMSLMMMLRAPLMCVVALILAFMTAPNMTWIIAIAVAAVLLSVVVILIIVLPKFKIFQKLVDKIVLLTRENLTGLRVIRAFNNEKVERRKFEKANNDLSRINLFVNRIMGVAFPLITIVFNGTTLLCSWIGVNLMQQDMSYLGNMMAFAQYATQVIMAFLMLSVLFVMIPRANVSATRINEVLLMKPKIIWKEKTAGVPNIVPSVEFSKVDFSYEDAEEKVLQNISFVAKAGETTAFIGSTGSGKSTLINLVPRFYDVTNGRILVNGIDVKDYCQDDLMKKIGYVPQKGILFAGDVASNIKFGARNASEEEMEEAARISQSKEFVEKLPEKYKSHIAQGGTNVSGGQKQRLSIARAVAKKPEIFIFDDSFSALDMKTDAVLRKALKPVTKDSVTLIVAQRISTIKDAEQIIVLDKGELVGKGRHLDLVKDCSVYREIVKSQFSEKEYSEVLKEAGYGKNG